jgi:1-acyl-sn-glycerol-3-phosphate acyltransferase
MLASGIDRSWRFLVTAFSFAAFGVGGLICGLVLFPILRVVVPDRGRRRRIARSLVGALFRAFIRLMAFLGGLKYDISYAGDPPGQGSYLIVANHPTLIDVVFLIALFPRADCIVKGSLWWNPFMAVTVRVADYISNRSPIEALDESIRRLRDGNSLILFPEGTRSVPGKALDFQLGAAAVAVRSGRPLLPVIISCDPPTLSKGEPWYAIPPRRVDFRMRVLQPVDLTSHIGTHARNREATQAANEFMLALFEREIGASQPGAPVDAGLSSASR